MGSFGVGALNITKRNKPGKKTSRLRNMWGILGIMESQGPSVKASEQ